ncbi:CaiB/BaiF CoA transferase family protein [Acrocarpospora catenulata]|uniref:CaiB/BaiF CoA transferase family protein n=1 Tax=Acrocarpospora catenulata TaxID=2836182 RepID=UPI001BD95F21|nr:CaiB/BaiF CoA-transferase family protein [Acrocarpospora catenulata]
MNTPLPLTGVRVVELASLAPAPLATLMLEDFGAEVTLVERPGGRDQAGWAGRDPLFLGGKRRLTLDLKSPEGRERVRDLAADADVFVEAFRPGVAERLGLGPNDLLSRTPGLIYLRVTGWGQHGPSAHRPGHDINYVAAAGALSQIGLDEPVAPPGFLGDFAGGSFLAVIGVLLALQARARTGRGQVVDAAMVDGVALLMSCVLELEGRGVLGPPRENPLRGAAPFYRSYRCADGRWFAVGAVEPPFYVAMLACLGIDDEDPAHQHDRARWPALTARVAEVFGTRTRAEWTRVFAGTEGCGTPVLDLDELGDDPHLSARGTYRRSDAGWQAAPAPRLSHTPGRRRNPSGGTR